MGSRMMHFIIANELASKFPIENKEQFLLGAIAPDAVATNKEVSHFFIGKHEEYNRRIAFEAFYNKYSELTQQDYILGYYCHLIADDLWLTGFFAPWLKNRIETDQEIQKTYHRDFHLLNGKLAEHYSINPNDVRRLKVTSDLPDIEEVVREALEKFLPFLMDDLNYSHRELEQSLEVFTIDQIVGYIETSIEKSIYFLNEKLDMNKY